MSRLLRLLPTLISTLVVAALLAGIQARSFPLGVPSEWEWSRPRGTPEATGLTLALLSLAAYIAWIALGARRIPLPTRRPSARLAAWLTTLVLAGLALQLGLSCAAPRGYGLGRCVTLALSGSSGYHDVARAQITDPAKFWRDFPAWIQNQDALHIGTHPPGLFLTAHATRQIMATSPRLARFIDRWTPSSLATTFRLIAGDLPLADRAALTLTAALTLLICVLTVLPLYGLVRLNSPPQTAWLIAATWPLIPAAVLFQPTADTAFPFLSCAALTAAAAARHSPSRRSALCLALTCGLLLAVGMQFTLAFLAVGLIVALIQIAPRGLSPRHRLERLLATGLGFLALTLTLWAATGANPFTIWWANQHNHARFYVQFPRTYLAWLAVNPIETAVALGLPLTVWALLALLKHPARIPTPTWATLAVLALLTLSGRSLSEVARLWLPFLPALLPAIATAWDSSQATLPTRLATLTLLGLQTIGLLTLIQVVYPV